MSVKRFGVENRPGQHADNWFIVERADGHLVLASDYDALATRLKEAERWVRELRDTVFEYQWSSEGGTEMTSWGCCPMGNAADWRGHKPDCELAKQIAAVDKWLADSAPEGQGK